MSWQRVQVFDRHLIQSPIVYAEAQTTVGILNKEHGQGPRQVRRLYGIYLEQFLDLLLH